MLRELLKMFLISKQREIFYVGIVGARWLSIYVLLDAAQTGLATGEGTLWPHLCRRLFRSKRW
jgi:hypothetical protein